MIAQDKNNPKNTSNARLGNKGDEIDSLEYYANLGSPVGAVNNFLKNGGRLPVTKFFRDFRNLMNTSNIGNGYFPYACSNNLLLLGYPGAECPGGGSSSRVSNNNNLSGLDCPTYILDPYGNKIYAIAMYDNQDDRQGYYVYLPEDFNSNSPIVVLVHGGGWFSGPNPDYVNGWTFPYSNTPTSTNLVKDLLAGSFVVVVPLYRLVKYGNTDSEINSNTTKLETQIDDLDAAIVHVKTNFPSCLGINANSIQILGESAGGHLALMWAYTKSTISSSYVKSVITCYAPTNLRQYGDYLQSMASGRYTCGNIYTYIPSTIFGTPISSSCSNSLPYYPFYFPVNITDNLTVRNSYTLTCTPHSALCTKLGVVGNTTLSDFRVLDSTYNIIQSALSEVIAIPNSSNTLQTNSPYHALNSGRIIPTYILHGNNDKLVPYNESTNFMSSNLSGIGGLIATQNNSDQITYDFSTLPGKHLIQTFPNLNHTFGGASNTEFYNIRYNILYWLTEHI